MKHQQLGQVRNKKKKKNVKFTRLPSAGRNHLPHFVFSVVAVVGLTFDNKANNHGKKAEPPEDRRLAAAVIIRKYQKREEIRNRSQNKRKR